jgi:small GTP-binding protein
MLQGVSRTDKPRVKVILVGPSNVGKTSLIASFFDKPFDSSPLPTVSPAYMFRELVRADGLTVCLQIWDTAGQERYHSVSQLFFRDADVALVCFEAGNQGCMDMVPDWVFKVKKEVPNCEFIFVATKIDLLDEERLEEAKAGLEKKFECFQPKGCFVTSALRKQGIEPVFNAAAEVFVPKHGDTRPVKVPETALEDGSGCC